VDRTRDRSLGVLVGFPDVQEESLVTEGFGVGGVDLDDGLFGLAQQFPETRHEQPFLSNAPAIKTLPVNSTFQIGLYGAARSDIFPSVSVRLVQLDEVVRRRRMVRSFSDAPVPPELLDRVLQLGLRGPSAGFSQGVDLLVIEGRTETEHFFELTSDRGFISGPGAIAGIRRAPVIVLPLADPAAYLARYAEEDKARSGLAGLAAEDWPVPYWLVDASFSAMLMLLAARDVGLGALFFRLHQDPGPLLAALGVPEGRQVIGALALGYEEQDPEASTASPARRARRPMREAVHRGGW